MSYKPKNILVLEAGGDAGMACIKLLKGRTKARIIAADMNKYVAASQLADKFYQVPPGDHVDFPNAILDLLIEERIDQLLPCFEHGHQAIEMVVPADLLTNIDLKSATLFKDKYRTYQALTAEGISVIPTQLLRNVKVIDKPTLIKPQFGSGSRGHFVVNNVAELDGIKRYLGEKEYIAQPYIDGAEWAIDVLVDNGVFVGAVTRRSILLRGSQCIAVEVKHNLKLIELAKEIQLKLNIRAPFQLDMFEKPEGSFYVIEINVRFGGGVIFTALSGFDQVSYLVNRDKKFLKAPVEGTYTRYYSEISYIGARQRSEGAQIVILSKAKKILLTKREDVPFWVLPGGGRKGDESYEQCAIREAREETGLSVKIIRTITRIVTKNNTTEIFLALCNHENVVINKEEVADYGWFEVNNLPKPLSLRTKQKIDDYSSQTNQVFVRRKNPALYKEILNLSRKPALFGIVLYKLILNLLTKRTFKV